MGFVTLDVTVGFQFFLSVGGFAAMIISLCWLIGSLLENHKRFIIYFICCRRKEKKEDVDQDDLIVAEDIDPEIVPHSEKNVWNLLEWLFCSMKIISYPKYNFVVRPTGIWRALLLALGVIFVVIFGIIKFWVAIAVLTLLYVGVILDYVLPFVIFIPEHKPSFERMTAAWNLSYMQRYIGILEEGYYQSPSVAYSFFKGLLLGTMSLAIICTVLGMYQIVFALSIPLSFALFSIILYILRFNCTCRKKKGEETALFEKHEAHLHVPFESPIFRVLSVLSVSILIPSICVTFLVLYYSVLGWTTGVFVMIWLFSFGFFLFKRYDRESAKAQAVFFWILLMLMGVIFLVGNAKQPESVSKSYAGVGRHYPVDPHPYAICSKRWYGMTVVDYGFLANLAYQSDPFFDQDLRILFPNFTDARIVYTYNLTASFYDLYIPSKNLSVISVRGTHLLIDLIQDLHIWKEIALLQFSSYIGPFTNFWPEQMTATVIYAVSLFEDLSVSSEDNQSYYSPLHDYVARIKGSRDIVMTGHSLGGGIVNIVGSKLEIPTVSFSPPGITFSRMKLGLSLNQINRMCTNIIPDNDAVTKIDKSGGLIQHVDCDQDFTKCHSVQRTIMTLIKSCGSDPLGRYLIGDL
jgi:hypothetical protein